MIDVAFTAADLRPAQVIVVLDVLRATSTATAALSAGYRFVLFAASIEQARKLRSPGRVLAGERRCLKPEDFDQGNSPREALERRGTDLVLSTANGAPTVIAAGKRAPVVLLGSLLNAHAVITALHERCDAASATITLACSGTDGRPAVEDVYAAGLISSRLEGPRSDAALIAEAVTRGYDEPRAALAASADAQVLRAAGLGGDIDDCAMMSTHRCVPTLLSATPDVAVVADRPGVERPLMPPARQLDLVGG